MGPKCLSRPVNFFCLRIWPNMIQSLRKCPIFWSLPFHLSSVTKYAFVNVYCKFSTFNTAMREKKSPVGSWSIFSLFFANITWHVNFFACYMYMEIISPRWPPFWTPCTLARHRATNLYSALTVGKLCLLDPAHHILHWWWSRQWATQGIWPAHG